MKKFTLYNVLTRKKEVFAPLRAGRVGLYTCGPTVYDFAHIGNLRTFIFEDVLRRALAYAGYRVRHIMNITDVEDKIIRDAKKKGLTIFEFTRPYEKAFLADMAALNVLPASGYPRATEHVGEMIAMITTLLKKGLAYQADGSVYFDISRFKPYGRLSSLQARALKTGSRVEQDEYAKRDAQDFALWKAAREGEPSWDAPFGPGRPGWHIECSAMATKYLGATLDIHAGGVDLIFPHHENEIAQSEGATGKTFSRFFVEGAHLLIAGEKMSKSLGNFFTLRDFEKRGIDPLVFRYLVLTAHYRTKLNFTWESLDAATQSLGRLRDFMRSLDAAPAEKKTALKPASLFAYEGRFDDAIADDLATPRALAALWSLERAYRKNPASYHPAAVRRLVEKFDSVLGLGLAVVKKERILAAARALAAEREDARKRRDWKRADEIRSLLRRQGYAVEDTPEGPRMKKA